MDYLFENKERQESGSSDNCNFEEEPEFEYLDLEKIIEAKDT